MAVAVDAELTPAQAARGASEVADKFGFILGNMADFYLLEDSSGHYQLEDASGSLLLEQQAGAFVAVQRRTSGFMTVRVGSRAVLTLLIVAVFLCF